MNLHNFTIDTVNECRKKEAGEMWGKLRGSGICFLVNFWYVWSFILIKSKTSFIQKMVVANRPKLIEIKTSSSLEKIFDNASWFFLNIKVDKFVLFFKISYQLYKGLSRNLFFEKSINLIFLASFISKNTVN